MIADEDEATVVARRYLELRGITDVSGEDRDSYERNAEVQIAWFDAIAHARAQPSASSTGEFKHGAEILIDDYACRVTAENLVELPAMVLDADQARHLIAWLQEVSPK